LCIFGEIKIIKMRIEAVFADRTSRSLSNSPLVLDDSHVTSVKILVVTITNKLSVSDHVRYVTTSRVSCAESTTLSRHE